MDSSVFVHVQHLIAGLVLGLAALLPAASENAVAQDVTTAKRVSPAPIVDRFDDGDATQDPPWIGNHDTWAIELLEDDFALTSRGRSRADTTTLAVHTDALFGSWSFEMGHRGINLSTYNGARVFVCARDTSLRHSPNGIFVQFGTNNTDAISLWQVDGDWTRRTRLGRASHPTLGGNASHSRIDVRRSTSAQWDVWLDGALIISAGDTFTAACNYFGIWVKHTEAGRRSFVFDDLVVEPVPAAEPPPPRPIPAVGAVILNEVEFDPPAGGSEFIEVYNRSEQPVSLELLTLRDRSLSPVPLSTVPADIPPDGYVVLAEDADAFVDAHRTIPFRTLSRWPTLNNAGDQLFLETDGTLVDSMSYVAADVLGTGSGTSLERIDPDAPSDRYNFALSVDPFGSTPGRKNSRFGPDRTPPSLVFAKAHIPNHLDLYFDEPIADAIDSVSVHIGGRSAVELQRITDRLLRARFPAPISDTQVSVARVADVRGNEAERTAAGISYRPAWTDLAINEILYEPLDDDRDGRPNQPEFIELINRSPRRLYLDGLFRTRDADERGNADTVGVGDAQIGLDPGDLVVLTAAVRSDAVPALLLPGLTLLNGGDVVRIHNDQAELIDTVAYAPTWHHPELNAHRGLSLERIDPSLPGSNPENWSTSVDPSGSTPGRPNSIVHVERYARRVGLVTASPNPFSPDHDGVEDVVRITCDLPSPQARIRVTIYNISGHLIRTLIPARIVSHRSSVLWDGRDDLGRPLRTGLYIAVVDVFGGGESRPQRLKQPIVLARSY